MMLRFYAEVARTTFRRQAIYRWANIAGLLTNIFFASIFTYVLIALYHARPVVTGYDLQDTLRYTWLIQSMIMVVTQFSWFELMMTIRSGDVVSDLSKPCDFCWYWFSREIGRSFYYLLYRGLPTYLAGMLLFGLGIPGEWHSWLLYLLVFPFAVLLGIAYRFLYNIVAFWLMEARAIVAFATNMALFFSGSFIPIPFFPPWLRSLSAWLPFNGLMNLPVQILLGKVSGGDVWQAIGIQIFWLVVLVLVGRLLTSAATRRVVVQGG
jgi:ABC-2 type transport system permease protein